MTIPHTASEPALLKLCPENDGGCVPGHKTLLLRMMFERLLQLATRLVAGYSTAAVAGWRCPTEPLRQLAQSFEAHLSLNQQIGQAAFTDREIGSVALKIGKLARTKVAANLSHLIHTCRDVQRAITITIAIDSHIA
jgi:hypothetical protein